MYKLYLKKIKLHTTFHVDGLVLSLPKLLGLERDVPDDALGVLEASEEREARLPEGSSTVDQVRNVKVLDVVSRQDIGVYLSDKVGPCLGGKHSVWNSYFGKNSKK